MIFRHSGTHGASQFEAKGRLVCLGEARGNLVYPRGRVLHGRDLHSEAIALHPRHVLVGSPAREQAVGAIVSTCTVCRILGEMRAGELFFPLAIHEDRNTIQRHRSGIKGLHRSDQARGKIQARG